MNGEQSTNAQVQRLRFTVTLRGSADDVGQKEEIEVLPDVTVRELLDSAVESFPERLGTDVSPYMLVADDAPANPLPDEQSLGELYAKGVTHLTIKRIPEERLCLCLYRAEGAPPKKVYPLGEGETTIGRRPTADIVVEGDMTVSRSAAVISVKGTGRERRIFIRREGAHFKLNNNAKEYPKGWNVPLSLGDRIDLGEKTWFILEEVDEDSVYR